MFTASSQSPTYAQLKASGYDDGYGKRPGVHGTAVVSSKKVGSGNQHR